MYTSTCLLVLCTVFFSCSDSNNFRQEPDTTIPLEEDKTNPSLIVNGDMEDDISMDLSTIAVSGVWSYIGGWNAKAAIVEQKENSGVNNSRCLAIIALDEDTDVMFAQKVTGLKSGGYYKASAKVKTDMIDGGMGANLCLDYLWAPTSGALTGSHSKWQDLVLEIDDVPENGEIILCLRLGNTAAASRGLAYFDDVVLKENQDLYIRTSKHFRLVVSQDLVPISDQLIDEWLANMDDVYECYKELFRGKVPFDGKIISIRSKEIDAWAYAGNPIQWNKNYIYESLQTIRRGDWCFGILHEIGHVFNIGDTSWNWNDEMFANFRMHYALEKNNGKVYMDGRNGKQVFTGGEILDMYKIDYENTIGTKVNDNGIHYMLARMAASITWEPYKKTFNYLRKNGGSGTNKYDKFVYFVNILNRFAKETNPDVDVWDYFSILELESIKKQLN